jgi:hypothetical protein
MTSSTSIKYKLFFASGDMITVFSRDESIKEIETRANLLQDFATQVIEYSGNETTTYKPAYSAKLHWTEFTEKGKNYSL